MCKNADFFCQNSPQKAHNNILVCRFRLFQITDSLSGSQMRREEVQLAPYSNWGHSQLQTRSETSPAWMFPTQVVAGAEYTCNRWLPANARVRACVCVSRHVYTFHFFQQTLQICRAELNQWFGWCGREIYYSAGGKLCTFPSYQTQTWRSRQGFFICFFSVFTGGVCGQYVKQTHKSTLRPLNNITLLN